MSHDSFEARALQLAYEMTAHNSYEGKIGQGHHEARAHDIRRLFNILSGRDAEEQGKKSGQKLREKEAEKRRKKFEALPPVPEAEALGRS